MGISIINDDGSMTPLKSNSSDSGYNVFSDNTFSLAEETIPAKVARNLYKLPASAASTLGGAPGDVWNTVSRLGGKISEGLPEGTIPSLLNLPPGITKLLWGGDGSMPEAPEAVTSEGIRKNITSPIGELLFGEGSQQPQPGFMEGAIDKAAQWAPYALLGGGAGAIGKGLGVSGLQGLIGQGLKEAGVGELGQTVGESALGLGFPLVSKLAGGATRKATKSIGKALKGKEESAWDILRQKSPKTEDVKALGLSKSLRDSGRDLIREVPPESRKSTEALFNEVIKDIGYKNTSVRKLVDARGKVSKHYFDAVKGKSTGPWNNFKTSIDEHIGKYMGSTHTDALTATKIKKAFEKTKAYEKFIKNAPEASGGLMNKIVDLAPLGGLAYSLVNKSPRILAATLATQGLSKVGSAAYKNAKLILGNKQLTDAAVKSAKSVVAKGAIGTIGVASRRGFDGKEISSKRTITIL